MKLVGQSVRAGSVLREGKVIGFTHHCLSFEGTPDDMQDIWAFVCTLKKGDAFRETRDRHPVTHWTTTEFFFTDKGAAAMVKLAFA